MKTLGKYFIFLQSLIVNRQSFSIYYIRIIEECILVGLGSIFISILLGLSLGGVVSLQTAYNFRKNPIAVDFFISSHRNSNIFSS